MEKYIEPTEPAYSKRARELVRIGREAIARADDAALDAYFSHDYVLHGPDGDIGLPILKAFFASMRAAFPEYACERLSIIEQGDFIATRTVMTGTFERPFEGAAIGTIQPNGRAVRHNVQNIFRFDADGRVAEEWIQYDNLSFLKQLGVEMQPAGAAVRDGPVDGE